MLGTAHLAQPGNYAAAGTIVTITQPPRQQRRALRDIGAYSALFAALTYSSFLLSRWTRPAASRGAAFISELEAPGQPYNWLFRLSDIASGLAIVVTALGVFILFEQQRRAKLVAVLVACVGVGSLIDGTTTMSCTPSVDQRCAAAESTASGLLQQLNQLHTDSGLIGFLSAATGAVLLGMTLMVSSPRWGRLMIATGLTIAATGLLDIFLLLAGADIGTTERLRTLLTSAWLAAIGVVLIRARPILTSATHQRTSMTLQPRPR